MATRRTQVFGICGLTLMLAGVATGCTARESARDSARWLYPNLCSETLGEDGDEHRERVMQSADIDRRGLSEDLDLWFQTERPTRLSRWHSK